MAPRRVMFFVPHPDDLEVLNAHGVLYFINKGFQVYEVLMTGGEYGVQFRFSKEGKALKGLKLQRIRAYENLASKRAYGNFPDGSPHVISIPMHYVDGFVPLTKKSINRIQRLIEQIQPEIIISPDSVYAIDYHHDHLATGRIVLFVLRKIQHSYLPKAYFTFQSFRSSAKFPLQSWDMVERVNLAHKSQMSPLMIKLLRMLVQRIYFPWRRNYASVHQVSLRDLRKDPPRFETYPKLIDRIFYAFMNHAFPVPTIENTYFPSPADLGLEIDPKDET
jgi:LmbE family N-acetylglucosaminyl deacetylase